MTGEFYLNARLKHTLNDWEAHVKCEYSGFSERNEYSKNHVMHTVGPDRIEVYVPIVDEWVNISAFARSNPERCHEIYDACEKVAGELYVERVG